MTPTSDEQREAEDAYARAVDAHAAGNLDVAEAAYREAADLGDADAAFQLALLLSDRGQYAEAAEAYEPAVSAGHAEAALNLALLYERALDRPDDARELWIAAAKRGDVRAMLDFANFLWEEGDYEGARAAFQRAIEAGEPRVYLLMGFLLADKEAEEYAEEALAAFEQAAARGVEGAWTQVGWQLSRMGRLEEAEVALREALKTGDPMSGIHLRHVLEAMGRGEEAEAVFQEAIKWAKNEVSLDYREVLAEADGEGLYEESLEKYIREETANGTPVEAAALLHDSARLAFAETRLKFRIENDDEAVATLAALYEKTGWGATAKELRNRARPH